MEVSSPKLLFENLELTPIYSILGRARRTSIAA